MSGAEGSLYWISRPRTFGCKHDHPSRHGKFGSSYQRLSYTVAGRRQSNQLGNHQLLVCLSHGWRPTIIRFRTWLYWSGLVHPHDLHIHWRDTLCHLVWPQHSPLAEERGWHNLPRHELLNSAFTVQIQDNELTRTGLLAFWGTLLTETNRTSRRLAARSTALRITLSYSFTNDALQTWGLTAPQYQCTFIAMER